MNTTNIIKNILNDLRVELTDEFDRNFERKSFFGSSWKQTKLNNSRGSLMMRTGKLRRSIRGQVSGASVKYSSSLPYANIHNEGGEITVTVQMKKFFWAMFYKSGGAAATAKGNRKANLSAEAMKWKGMALMKVGQKIKIEKRQFIGFHSSLNPKIEHIIENNLKDIETALKNRLKR